MMKQTLLLPLSLVVGVGVLQASEAKKQQPNVILIMADDLGWGDVGFNGNTKIKTPCLDKMASEGAVLSRFYSGSAVSSPTRASVLTGRSPMRTGVFNANFGILREEEITIPELLKEQGYATGHFGKWHLGTLTITEKDANRGKPENTKEFNPPALHGYIDAFVTESKVPTWDPMLKPEGVKIGTAMDADKSARQAYGTAYWDIDGKKVTDNLLGDDSRVIMDRVIPFIDKNKKNPFLAVVWFHTPHAPCVAGPEYAAMYKDESVKFQNYAGCVTAMDEQIGRLNDYLKANKLDENTMIWFCSDNGPENNSAGVTGGFMERKRSLHEGGVRVPGLVVWKGVVKAGSVIDAPLWVCDYLPTVAAATGVGKEKIKYELDGINVKDIISGKQAKRNSAFVHTYGPATTYQSDDFKLFMFADYLVGYDISSDKFEKNPKADDSRIAEAKKAMFEVLDSYKDSFNGEEYGKVSYDRMKHTWSQFRVKVPANLDPNYVAPAKKK